MRELRRISIELVVALLAVLAAWFVHRIFAPLLGEKLPFITFMPAVFALAWWGGLRPTIFVTCLSLLVLRYYILEPKYSLSFIAIQQPEYRYGVGIFVAISLTAGWMGERLHAARKAAKQAADRAVAERERLRVTLASIGDAVIVTDAQGAVLSLNAVAELLTGWPSAEASGQPLQNVFRIANESTRLSVEDPCAKVLRTGKIVGLANHTILLARNGREWPIDDSAAPIRDAQGTICGVVIVFRDVSEKRQAEQILKRSQWELADFFDNAAIPIHSTGPGGVILRANQAELDLLGYERDEYVGHRLAEFHVDQRLADEVLSRLSRGEVVHNCEARLRCKSGVIKDVLITASALWDEGGFVHTRCFTRDITDRKLAEETLSFMARASSTLAALADRESALQQSARIAVPYLADWCVVYVVDEQGAIDYHAHAHADPAKEQLLTQMLMHSPLDWSSNTATVRALKTGESQLMADLPEPFLDSVAQGDEHRQIIRQLGPRAVISVPLKIRDQIVGVIGLVSCDVSRRYTQREVELAETLAERVAIAVDNSRLYHAVKEASRHKDEFLAMLAHELRNPLAAIRYAVALGQMPGDDESPAELFSIVDRQTQSLALLIDDLLDMSRISGDKVKLRRQSIEVATIVERATTTVRPLFEQKQHSLHFEIEPESMLLFADPTRTEQIIANLLTNAAKYTPTGGCVTVRTRRQYRDALIEVVDTGVGLTSEMLSRVFELFAQADRTLDRSEGGLGIGLTVAKKLAEMHGGSITASSDGLGKGATFMVRLPLSEVPADVDAVVSLPMADSDFEPLRILVIDDNRDTADSCAKLLRKMGHAAAVAHDGPAAVAETRNFRPQVLFLDIGLPGMSGYDVARTLRNEGFRNEVIIAVSGYGQPDDRRRSREAGFDEHLVKPVDQAAILSALKTARQKAPAVS